MNNNTSEKIKIISFFSIIMVVFLHSYNLDFSQELASTIQEKPWNWFVQDMISYGFTRVAVPLFFLFSGFWFFYKTTGTAGGFILKMKKRVKTLLIPFLFWSLAGIALYFALQSLPQFAKFFSKELVKNYTVEMWFVKIFIQPIPYQLWFIRDLMVLVLLSPLLYFLLNRIGKIFLAVALALWLYHFEGFHNSIEALLFFAAGGFIAMFQEQILHKNLSREAPLLNIIWIVLLIAKSILGWYCAPVLVIQLLLKVAIFTGIVAFWSAYDWGMQDHPKLRSAALRFSAITFFIYASHEPLLTIIKKVLFIIFGKAETGSLIVYLAAPVLTIAIVSILALALRKYLTAFYGVVTGGR